MTVENQYSEVEQQIMENTKGGQWDARKIALAWLLEQYESPNKYTNEERSTFWKAVCQAQWDGNWALAAGLLASQSRRLNIGTKFLELSGRVTAGAWGVVTES